CSRMNTIAVRSSGPASPPPRWTAETSTPIAIAKAAGSRPRAMSIAHHAVASTGSAFGKAANIFQSSRLRRRVSTADILTDRTGLRAWKNLTCRATSSLDRGPERPAAIVSTVPSRLQLEELRVAAACDDELLVGA